MEHEEWNLTLYPTIEDFLTQAKEFMLQNEAENSLIIGLANNCKGPSPLFFNPVMISASLATIQDGRSKAHPISFIAFQSFNKNNEPVYPFIVSQMKNDSSSEPQYQITRLMSKLATFLVEKNIINTINEITGPSEESTCLVAQLDHLFPEKQFKVKMDQRFFKLTKESYSPVSTHGFKAKKASLNDLEIVTEWYYGFKQDTFIKSERTEKEMEAHRSMADYHIKHGNIFFLVADNSENEYLSMVNIGRETDNGANITCVYTPSNRRRNGYASILLSLLIQEEIFERRRKEYVCLFTDLSNPTSNHIYQEVGFRPVYNSKLFGL